MTRAFKTLLLWLMMAALPLQAGAAILNAASCGPTLLPSAQVADRHVHAVAAHDACDCHHDTACCAPAGDAPDSSHGNANCHAGTMCCAGAVAPPSVAPSISLCKNADTAAFSLHKQPNGTVPAKPERPPRSIFA
jgi:hypothetical protein